MRSSIALALLIAFVPACEKSSTPPPPTTTTAAPPTTKAPTTAPPTPAPAPGLPSAPSRDAAIKEFWVWFASNAASLQANKDMRAVMEKISAELAKIDKGVFAEIGADKKTRTLVLSADGNKSLFPVVQALYAARPKVAGWDVVAFRQRNDQGQLKDMKFEMAGKQYDATMITFVAQRAESKLDIVLYSPSEDVSEPVKSMMMIMLDHSIGEYDTETKIGGIDFLPKSKAPKEAQSLSALPAVVDKTFPPAK